MQAQIRFRRDLEMSRVKCRKFQSSFLCIIYKSSSIPSIPASWASSSSTRPALLPPRMPRGYSFTHRWTSRVTYSDSNVNTVGTVTIDGSHLFSESARYKRDVPIVVSYYYLNEPEPPTDSTPTSEETEPAVYSADEESIKQLAEDKIGFEYNDLSVSWDDFDEA